MSARWTARPMRGVNRWRNTVSVHLVEGDGNWWEWRGPVERDRVKRWVGRGVTGFQIELDGRPLCFCPVYPVEFATALADDVSPMTLSLGMTVGAQP